MPVLAGHQAAAVEDRGAGHDHAQGQRLAGQVHDPGPDVLAEQQLSRQDGLDQGQAAEVPGGDAPGWDWLPGPDAEPGILRWHRQPPGGAR
jgi:hypothetical protein